ncbi:MAG: hypothetical protein WA930_15300, partial [Rhodanobacter sp.]
MSRTDQIAPNRPAAPTRGSGEMPAPSSLRAQRTRTALLGGGVMLMLLFTAVSLLLARDDEPRPLTYRPMAAAQAPARLPAAPARPSPLAAEKLGNSADARVPPTIAAATSRR